ncbi:MAG: radical SAM family heme chaperone HemW [Planctomycetes bacterium]|nr:radical SAM family heme chaperone HemW [Planctomycetota bacterium]
MTASGAGRQFEAPPSTPLYVHLPFCAAKCHYCDFFSVPAEGQDVEGTLAAVELEIRLRAPRAPRTLFLGGGTPSLLSISQLRRLFDALQQSTGFRDSAVEVTVECNPESLDEDKARALLDLGVTRLSIGFQSLRGETLQLFGRVHGVDQSFRAFDAARRAGIESLNVDLIYANPGQTLEQWQTDLRRVLALEPEHVSAYNLTFEEDTLFRRWLQQGRLQPQSDDAELEFFWWTREHLASTARAAYEISNFALNGHQCAHNVNYWNNGTYVGVGPSAVSKLGFERSGNVRQLGEYRRRMAHDEDPRDWDERPSAWARLGESWWLGLRRTEGLSALEAWTRAGLTDWRPEADPALDIARRSSEQGWLEQIGERWALTQRGWPLADAVAREFLRLGQLNQPAPAELLG